MEQLHPSSASKRATDLLTAEGVSRSTRAARVKLPDSAARTKVLISLNGSISAVPCIHNNCELRGLIPHLFSSYSRPHIIWRDPAVLNFIRSLYPKLLLLSAAVTGASQAAPAPGKTHDAFQKLPLPPAQIEGRSALLMIEFVNEWLAEDGKLHGLIEDEATFRHSQHAAQRALAAARRSGMPVIHATLQMSSDYRELGRTRFGLRGAIRRFNTWKMEDDGWRFHPSFAPRAEEFVVSGRAGASAFSASNLDNYLRGQGITRLYLAGYATHVCIESTLRAAHDLGYEPIVLSDSTAAFTEQQQRHVLEHVVHHFGWTMPVHNFIASLEQPEQAATLQTALPPANESAAVFSAVTAPGQEIPGISGAIVLNSGLILLSGHVPLSADGSVDSGLHKQLEKVFQNMEATLREAGSGIDRLVRLTFYVRNYQAEHLATIREIRDRWLQGHAPASALIGVESLFRPDVLVEVDAMAVR